MNHYYITFLVSEETPSYDFVIKAQDFEEAKSIASKIIAQDYPESWEIRPDNFTCEQITGDQLLKIMTLN